MHCDLKTEESNIPCKTCECNNYIDYPDDLNCTLVCVRKNGPLTLEEVSKRLGVSYVRIKQIEDKAIRKLKEHIKCQDEMVF